MKVSKMKLLFERKSYSTRLLLLNKVKRFTCNFGHSKSDRRKEAKEVENCSYNMIEVSVTVWQALSIKKKKKQ